MLLLEVKEKRHGMTGEHFIVSTAPGNITTSLIPGYLHYVATICCVGIILCCQCTKYFVKNPVPPLPQVLIQVAMSCDLQLAPHVCDKHQ